MVTTATGLNVPAGTDPFDPQLDFGDLAASLSGRIIVPVANVAARATLVAAVPPSPSQPLVVYRADAGTGLELETSSDGVTWRTLGASVWATFVPSWAAGMTTSSTEKARLIRQGGMVTIQLAVTVLTMSGTIRLNLPAGFNAAATAVDPIAPVGVATAGGATIPMSPVFVASTTQLGMRYTDTGEWGVGRPFGWQVGNRLALTATFEGA